MKRILISAYAVSPIRGSECAVGWEIATRLGEYFDVTVLMCEKTPSNNTYYNEVEEYLRLYNGIKNVSFVPVKMPKSSIKFTKLHDIGFWPAYYLGYKCWQKEAYRIAKDLHSKNKFDLNYQLNMIGFREPGYLWKIDIPFIWGPINGFHSIPFSFIRDFNVKDLILQALKHLANEAQVKFSIRAKKAIKAAYFIWCVDEIALYEVLRLNSNAEILQETGVNSIPDKSILIRNYDGIRCLNLVWSGMITTGKALDILLEALIKLKNLNFHLTVIGDGPQSNRLKKKSKQLNSKITWTGWITRQEVINKIKKSDLLIFTSLKEATSVTVMEAISLGVPVVCHNTCGMAAVVNVKNGFKIPYKNTKTSVEFLTDLLENLIDHPEILNNCYKSIWDTTDDLSWDSKVLRIAKKIDSIKI